MSSESLSSLLLALTCCGAPPGDTLHVRVVPRLPSPAAVTSALGEPDAVFGGGRARIWLVRAGDTVAVYASVRDEAATFTDEVVVSVDQAGDAADAPQHDDFQWRFRRVLDSSVVSRGREGRWAPPRDDPDWRLGREREGGGWQVEAEETTGGWCVVLRLHAAWLEGSPGRRPRMAFRVYDGEPAGWYAWPRVGDGAHPSEVEGSPMHWVPVAFKS